MELSPLPPFPFSTGIQLIIYGINQAYQQNQSVATPTSVTSPVANTITGIPDCTTQVCVVPYLFIFPEA